MLIFKDSFDFAYKKPKKALEALAAPITCRLSAAERLHNAYLLCDDLSNLDSYTSNSFFTVPSPWTVSPWPLAIGQADETKETEQEEQPPKILSMEHIVAPVVAWRAWNAPLFGDRLRSISLDTEWPIDKALKAECDAGHCGGVDCACGIYAHKTQAWLSIESYTKVSNLVFGQVNIWGVVLECEYGYRAQYAYPKAFLDVPGTFAARFAEIYRVSLLREE